jgi:hypothetical protein
MTEKIREQIRLEDGRHAERVTQDDCDGTEVIETWVEPKRKLRLSQRQIVRRRPCVYERETEILNEETGDIVSREVEDMGQPKLQVCEQIVSAASLPEERDSGFVSREELREDIKDAMVTLAKTMGSEEEYEYEEEPHVSVQNIIEERLEEKKPVSQLNLVLLAVIAAEVAGLAWILFIL